jgi:hypothetical protein
LKENSVRKVFLVVAILLIVDMALQFYFAALGVFAPGSTNEEQFALHTANGRIVLPVLCLLVIAAAALARAGGRTIGLSVAPLVLVVFQTILFILGGLTGTTEEAPTVAGSIVLGFHALVGLSAFMVAYMLVQRARRLVATGSAMPVGDREPKPVTTATNG